MNRIVVIIGNKEYKGYVSRVRKEIKKILIFSKEKYSGFSKVARPYEGYLYEKVVSENEIDDFYREYFLASYMGHDFYVIDNDEVNKKFKVLVGDSNIAKECDFDWVDRDFFTKWLGKDDKYQLLYIRDYFDDRESMKKEITINEYFDLYKKEY